MATTYEGYALLIGCNEHPNTTGPLAGNSRNGLRAAINDLRVYWDLARAIGIKPANIRVLAAPEIEPGELQASANGVTIGRATSAEIVAGVTWLAKNLGSSGTTCGLLAFSGLGDYKDGTGLVLCGTDVKPDLSGTVSLAQIRSLLQNHAPNRRLYAMLDTCFFGPESLTEVGGSGRPRCLSGKVQPANADLKLLRPGDKVSLAADIGATTYEAPTRHGWHGPLSASVMEALDIAGVPVRGGDEQAPMATGDAADSLDGLLAELGLRDEVYTPVPKSDPPEDRDNDEDPPDAVDNTNNDNGELSGGLEGFRIYDILINSVKVGQVNIDTTVNGVHKETWFIDQNANLDGAWAFRIGADTNNPPLSYNPIGGNVVSWDVDYNATNWGPGASEPIPAFNAANNVRTYRRAGSPTTTPNRWIVLRLPKPGAQGSLTWYATNSSLEGMIFQKTDPVGSIITYDKLTVGEASPSTGRKLVEPIG